MQRNLKKLGKQPDPVLEVIKDYKLNLGTVLEVGAANGWRGRELYKYNKITGYRGIDPCAEIPTNELVTGVMYGTADNLGYWRDNTFNTVIYGFCLYLCDPEDYCNIVAEGNRVLRDGGYLIIYDFYPHYNHKRPYKHKKGLWSYKMEFSDLWLGNPTYHLYARRVYGDEPDDQTAVTILKKNIKIAFPEKK